ncbi:MAG: hypothetical protein WA979_03470 [Pacificimonas sp.]
MKLSQAIIVAVVSIAGTFFFICISSLIMLLMGAVAGWLGGLLFPGLFTELAATFVGYDVPAWQIGAGAGFVGAFFRGMLPRPPWERGLSHAFAIESSERSRT